MRIMHVIDTLHVGGAERMLIDLVVEQSKRGHQLSVVCIFELGELAEELAAFEVPVYSCDKQHGSTFVPLWHLYKTIHRFQPEVLHSHNCLSGYYVAVLHCLLVRNARLINTFHGIGLSGIGKRRVQLYGLSLRVVDKAVSVCKVANQNMKAHFPGFSKKIDNVVNGIVLDRFIVRNQEHHIKLRQQLNCTENTTHLIGIVARLNPVKNHRLLFAAFANLCHHFPVELVIIGDGELRQELQSYAQTLGIERITHFMGDRRDVNELLAGLDLYVLCSNKEGYSISLLEATASGLPIVATDVGGNSEIVQDGENGLLVPVADVAALTQAMTRILSDSKLAEDMGRASRLWVEQFGSVQSMADSYDRLYATKK